MNNVLVILTIHTDNLPANFPEILKEEQAHVMRWKEEGILEQLFLRPTRNGAILIFKDIDEEGARQKMTELPFYAFMKSMEVLPMMKSPDFN